jgi:hypothetical protein
VGGAHAVEDADDVHHRPDVGAVDPAPQRGRPAQLRDQVRGRAAGQGLDGRGAVAVVEHQGVLLLQQTGRLQVAGLGEAGLVDLDPQAAGEARRGRLQGVGVGAVGFAHAVQERLQPRPVQVQLSEVLRGPHEHPRARPHGPRQRPCVAAGVGGEEQDHLLRARRHDQVEAAASLGRPALVGGEPPLGRRVGGPAQERGHQQVMRPGPGRRLGLDMDPVAGGEVRRLGDRQGRGPAGDGDLERRTGEIELRLVGPGGAGGGPEAKAQEEAAAGFHG